MIKIHDFSAHFPEESLFNDNVSLNKGFEEFKRLFFKENIETEYQIWEFKVDSKQYPLSIRDKEVTYIHLPLYRKWKVRVQLEK
ncbi:hypothetical protein [Neobacillus mesonae]|uniref:Uncharacterized protein n=1 Tax=Neobacillus mesonae TaxID=1193713 RepID=A0A3T0HX36_9BACI|nr:hypothetical protein [Neobacillus mesonae]AZU61672.1 hypothetical protein CHR53_10500 [Neobacillus mesonae]